MTEPEALARADEIGAESVRLELESIDAFVHAHYPRLIRLASLITRDGEQAQDAVQGALERAWRKRGDVREPAKLRPWLDRIVAREAIRQVRGSGFAQFARRESEDWIPYAPATSEPTEGLILREALGRLSTKHRAVVALHLYAGYSVEETARVLSVPFDTVRSRLRAAREQLRRELGEKC